MNDSSIGAKPCDGIETITHVVFLFTASNKNMKLSTCNSVQSNDHVDIDVELSVDIFGNINN